MQKAFSSPQSKKSINLIDTLGLSFHWWKRSLASCLPVRAQNSEDETIPVMDLLTFVPASAQTPEAQIWRADIETAMRASATGRKRLFLRLDRSMVFERPLLLPEIEGIPLRELAQAGAADLPFEPSEIVRAYSSQAPVLEGGARRVLEYTAKRALVETCLEIADDCGLELAGIGLVGQNWDGARIDFLQDPALAARAGPDLRKWLGFALLAGLCLSFFWMNGVRQAKTSALLESKIFAIEPEALDIRAAISAVTQSQTGLAALKTQKQKSADPLMVLLHLTESIGPETYLSSFDMQGREVQISGLSKDAAGVFEAVEADPVFSGVAFSAPTTKDPSFDLERFGLKFATDAPLEEEGAP